MAALYSITRYITGYYSQLRPHWYNNGLAPNESERLFWQSSQVMTNFCRPLQLELGSLKERATRPTVTQNRLETFPDFSNFYLFIKT